MNNFDFTFVPNTHIIVIIYWRISHRPKTVQTKILLCLDHKNKYTARICSNGLIIQTKRPYKRPMCTWQRRRTALCVCACVSQWMHVNVYWGRRWNRSECIFSSITIYIYIELNDREKTPAHTCDLSLLPGYHFLVKLFSHWLCFPIGSRERHISLVVFYVFLFCSIFAHNFPLRLASTHFCARNSSSWMIQWLHFFSKQPNSEEIDFENVCAMCVPNPFSFLPPIDDNETVMLIVSNILLKRRELIFTDNLDDDQWKKKKI